ncbi:hypothetical protein F4821DRAFT_280338 [Hypoxylon rubiginosum]|uniref:Uncharacterized protein n=1 Tax=Hypoxylon rubiginosum TaxID=110542 RepID=A0ACC0CUU3_9PEZI|nr:hypothetical protein F4821DRAFT_280338 [Hypoxylon rubiginosum]
MCSVCSTLTQRNHSCGHQLLLRKGNATFCLFYPHKADEYHSVITQYEQRPRDHECKECQIRREAASKGLRGAERHDYIKKTYARTWEAKSKVEAKNAIAQAEKSRESTTPEMIDGLNKKAREQVKYYLRRNGRNKLNAMTRRDLLKTVLGSAEANDAIDRKALVRVFGSYCVWDQKDKTWKGMPSEERNALIATARRVNLSRTLEEGLAMTKPEDLEDPQESTE